MCGETLIIQSNHFLSSSAVPRISLVVNKNLTYQEFHVDIKCIVSTLSSNRVLSFNKLPHVQKVV